jgi:nucleoside-diphosphate-sugar epimerase
MTPGPSAPLIDAEVAAGLQGRRLWVTGAKGFLGVPLVEAAEQGGATVIPFRGDLRDAEQVEAALADAEPEIVLHLAARVDPARDPGLFDEMHRVNVLGTTHVGDALVRSAPDALLVHVGTCEEYGLIPAPFAEDATEGAPASPYGQTKLAATRLVLGWAGRQRVRVARPFLTYGASPRARGVLPGALRAAVSGQPFVMTRGEQTREWNHVDDTIRGLLRMAVTPGLDGLLCNIACGEERRVVDVVAMAWAEAGADPGLLHVGALPERPAEVPRFFADVRRCRSVLGHHPRVDLREGIRRCLATLRDCA